ncbi:MAG: hypothetical protein HC898_09015 [Phycisphaerales bacterium]|nr:hypothetical protein [Phycisphaerales bacterium]
MVGLQQCPSLAVDGPLHQTKLTITDLQLQIFLGKLALHIHELAVERGHLDVSLVIGFLDKALVPSLLGMFRAYKVMIEMCQLLGAERGNQNDIAILQHTAHIQ